VSTVATELDLQDIRSRIAERREAVVAEQVTQAQENYRYVRPLLAAADRYIEYVQNPDGRYMLGLHGIDLMTRGFGKGELALVVGRTHEGKSQLVINGIANNPDKRTLYFSLDEPTELVLAKLVAIRHGIGSEDLEARIKAGDAETAELVRRSASHDFKNLIVIDEPLGLREMKDALLEAEHYWDDKCDVAAFDYLELFPGANEGGDGVVAKAQGVKRWVKEADVVGLCVHQAKSTGSERGQSAGFGAARYGGNSEAIFGLEVFRKRDDESLSEWDRDRYRNTISVNLFKNKRPPCRTGSADCYLDANTGLIRELRDTDLQLAGIKDGPVRTVLDHRDGVL
jgi:KaiC/GvpD/RAD55 family RecA-like ATPase